MLTTITIDQFVNKVSYECPFEFLIGECEISLESIENMLLEELRNEIKKHAENMSESSLIGFIELNCRNLNLYS